MDRRKWDTKHTGKNNIQAFHILRKPWCSNKVNKPLRHIIIKLLKLVAKEKSWKPWWSNKNWVYSPAINNQKAGHCFQDIRQRDRRGPWSLKEGKQIKWALWISWLPSWRHIVNCKEWRVYEFPMVAVTKYYKLSHSSRGQKCQQCYFLLRAVRNNPFQHCLLASGGLLAIFSVPWLVDTSL